MGGTRAPSVLWVSFRPLCARLDRARPFRGIRSPPPGAPAGLQCSATPGPEASDDPGRSEKTPPRGGECPLWERNDVWFSKTARVANLITEAGAGGVPARSTPGCRMGWPRVQEGDMG